MHRIGILYNPFSVAARHFAATIQQQQPERVCWCGCFEEARQDADSFEQAELLVALGGDGTALRAAWLAIPRGLPVLAVAMGHLNFLTELLPDELMDGLDVWFRGDGWHDARSLIDVTLYRDETVVMRSTGLNEAVISRGDIGRVTTVEVRIDETPLTSYRADGVIVSTATGSTAYALSAGGPIVDPRSHALVLVPVAAHLTAVHSMVLHQDAMIDLLVHTCHHATLSVDGRENLHLEEGDRIQVRRSQQVCLFARVRPFSQFYCRLVERLRRT